MNHSLQYEKEKYAVVDDVLSLEDYDKINSLISTVDKNEEWEIWYGGEDGRNIIKYTDEKWKEVQNFRSTKYKDRWFFCMKQVNLYGRGPREYLRTGNKPQTENPNYKDVSLNFVKNLESAVYKITGRENTCGSIIISEILSGDYIAPHSDGGAAERRKYD